MESWQNELKRLIDLKLMESSAEDTKIAEFIQQVITDKEADLEKWKRALAIYKKA